MGRPHGGRGDEDAIHRLALRVGEFLAAAEETEEEEGADGSCESEDRRAVVRIQGADGVAWRCRLVALGDRCVTNKHSSTRGHALLLNAPSPTPPAPLPKQTGSPHTYSPSSCPPPTSPTSCPPSWPPSPHRRCQLPSPTPPPLLHPPPAAAAAAATTAPSRSSLLSSPPLTTCWPWLLHAESIGRWAGTQGRGGRCWTAVRRFKKQMRWDGAKVLIRLD